LSTAQTVLDRLKMLNPPALPTLFLVGTKYVLEGCGMLVRRYIEFSSSRRVQLKMRKRLAARARHENGNKRELFMHQAMTTAPCLLWVKSRHWHRKKRYPLYPQKRPRTRITGWSILCPHHLKVDFPHVDESMP